MSSNSSTPPANAGEKNIEQAFNDIQDAMIRLPGSTPDRCCEAAAQIIVDLRAQLASRPSPSEQAAKDAKIVKLLSAAKNCGGGDLYIQEYGRTCHCPFHTQKGGVTRDQMACRENHSTACNDMWNAIKSALSLLSLLGEPAKGSEA